MNIGFTEISNNIGVSVEMTILIVFLLSSIIFFARNFKIGMFIIFLGSGTLFMWMYHLNLNWTPFIIVFFMSLVVISFTLYFTNKTVEAGGFI